MNRSMQCDAVILQSTRMGDLHKRITLLSPDMGLIFAAAFGARKSGGKLSGLAQPFVSGRFFLYANPLKDQYKIEDIKAYEHREKLHQDLPSLYAASFFAELIIKTYSGGSEQYQMYQLFMKLLDLIEKGTELTYLLIQGSWRFLGLLGLCPEVDSCTACGRPLDDRVSYLHISDHGLWCADCVRPSAGQYEIGSAERRYLLHTQTLALERGVQVKLQSRTAAALKQFLIQYLDSITDGQLKTVRSGLL